MSPYRTNHTPVERQPNLAVSHPAPTIVLEPIFARNDPATVAFYSRQLAARASSLARKKLLFVRLLAAPRLRAEYLADAARYRAMVKMYYDAARREERKISEAQS